MKSLFLTSSIIAILCSQTLAAHAKTPLQPRAEINWRAGNERSILMHELWFPLAQNNNSVMYLDLRLMGDDSDNHEGNAGIGYRKIMHDTALLGSGVIGAHAWLDQRITENGSRFKQTTLGLEWLGKHIDILANGYIPLSDVQYHTIANNNPSSTGFSGTGIVVSTDEIILEEPQSGFDIEIGMELGNLFPLIKETTDSARLYSGAYYFNGDNTDKVSGWRTRINTDITENLQIGARYQRDAVRGSQMFLEATLRLPYGHKQSYRQQGLYARLDDSPERDIDIVTGGKTVQSGDRIPLLNSTTGTEQQIIHVDNTATGIEDGSAENPYNTLLEAQTAATNPHTIIYVHSGSGTSGQSDGIILNQTGMQLIGAGSDLTFDNTLFSTANGQSVSSNILIPATTAPTITNTGGDGITILADNVKISGITVDGASDSGITFSARNNITIDNVTAQNNTNQGIVAYSNNAHIDNLTITNSNASNNGQQGIYFYPNSGSTVDNLTITNNTTSNNGSFGIYVRPRHAGTTVTTANITNNTATNNSDSGVYIRTTDSATIKTATITNNTLSNNAGQGIYTQLQSAGTINTVTFTDNTLSQNTNNGSLFVAQNTNSEITNITIANNTADQNGRRGYQLYALTDGVIDTATVKNNTATNNTQATQPGFWAFAFSNGQINDLTFHDNTASGNQSHGFSIQSSGAGSNINVTLTDNTSHTNLGAGYSVYTADSGNVNSASFSNNTATNNTLNGIRVLNSSTGTLNADLGGGSTNSTGQNSFYNNTDEEIALDINGAELKAENNYWGNASGLTGAETDLSDGSTIDSAPYLTSNPNN